MVTASHVGRPFRAVVDGLERPSYRRVLGRRVLGRRALGRHALGRHRFGREFALSLLAALLLSAGAAAADATSPQDRGSILYKVQSVNEKLEMIVSSSRILTMDHDIPQVVVNNPDILVPTVLSPRQIQIAAKKPGVTQVNLWDESKNIYTIDVVVMGDARELSMLLKTQFPNASLRVVPVSAGVLISGFVDQPEHVGLILRISEKYYPEVINAITVGGVQQVLLHIKVMEVSRTKLRNLGFDWTQISGGSTAVSNPSGLINGIKWPSNETPLTVLTNGANTMFLGVLSGNDAFFAVLEAMRRDNLMKVHSEPTLVTVSGRPAQFKVGGQFPIIVPQSLGTNTIDYKSYGTVVDFVPIVLGNGNIRLELRPSVSEIDASRTVTLNGLTVPGIRERVADTAVEMQAGQTLAIAGLVQDKTESMRQGVPWVSELPYVGALFRRVHEERNEVEIMIMVTPELVDAMSPCETPPGGPGLATTSPCDWELYMKGYIEVPDMGRSGSMGPPHAFQGAGMMCPPPEGIPQSAVMSGPEGMPGMIPSSPVVRPESVPTPTPGPALGPSGSPPPSGKSGRPAPQSRTSPSNHQKPPSGVPATARAGGLPNFLGPIGYDIGQ